ncbi:hypothetical protein EC991_004503 [Linnemannia zychae]|nr:hypothetical protein EC991_004503 [Linnemannia zychae]
MATSQTAFSSIIPPEVLERIALFADPNTLTICIRTCRLWFDCFLPALYKDINVYHFDYLSTELSNGYPSRSDRIPRTKDTVGYGGQFIHKHCRLIKSIKVGTPKALKYLHHPDCTNLEYVTVAPPLVKNYWHVRGMPADFSQYRAMPRNAAELTEFASKFPGRYEWLPLFAQNPGLRRISMDVSPETKNGIIRIAKAMGSLKQLEDLHIKFVRDCSVMEALMDFCPQVRKITFETFINKYSSINQTFRSRDNFTQMTNEPKTQIRELNIFSQGRKHYQPWIVAVLWRCPLLESLIVPLYQTQDSFPVIVRALIEHCPEIQHLHVRMQEEFKGVATVNALADLLNSGCPRLTSLKLYDAADLFLLEHHFANHDLRRRLEKFEYISCASSWVRNGATVTVSGSELEFGALSVCPNLRVFEAPRRTLCVFEFLEMDIVCLETLTTLHLRLRYEETVSSEVVKEDVQQAAEDDEGDKEEAESNLEWEDNKEEKESMGVNETQKEEEEDRVYDSPSLQSRVIAKLAQFTVLKELCLGSKPEGRRYRDEGVNMLKFKMGEEELQKFSQMRRLQTLKVEGINYSRKIRRMRWK